MISLLKKEQSAELADFLTLVFGDDYREMAQQHVTAMFDDGLSTPYFLVHVENNKIVGAAAISEAIFTVNTWGIGWVAVHSDYRKQGIGHGLLRACLKEIAKRNPPQATAILSVYPDIAPFYEKLGFKGSSVDYEGSPYLTLPVS